MKLVLQLLIVVVMLVGCKPTIINFNEDRIDFDYIRNIIVTAEGFSNDPVKDPHNNKLEAEDTVFTMGRIFMTELEDRYVIRDGIVEETIANTDRVDSTTDLMEVSNTYRIYIVTAKNEIGSAPAILIPAIFNADGDCIGLGPALLGRWGAQQLVFYKQMKWNPKSKNQEFKWEYDTKESKYKKSKSIYFDKGRTMTKKDIIAVTDKKGRIIELETFNITRIYNASENKFGGNKALLFVIKDIFQDAHALHFTVVKNL